MKTKTRPRLSRISALHYVKLAYRSALFLAAAAVYVRNRILRTGRPFGGLESRVPLLLLIWLVFAAEMVLRFFPSGQESMGCQKQFACNYIPAASGEKGSAAPVSSARATAAVALSWLALNGVLGALYLTGVWDAGIMLLISLAFSVCDMVCILFFCPFQTWFLKNKCCVTCRIYNWDYAMMFTPLLFVRSLLGWSLLALSLVLLAKWEILCRLHPERFSEAENASLSCASCREKLCQHKTQLRRFQRRHRLLS